MELKNTIRNQLMTISIYIKIFLNLIRYVKKNSKEVIFKIVIVLTENLYSL